jgi:uncharacterized protein (TIGR02145 family)
MTAVGGSSTAGKKLKATSGWGSNASWNGTDDYGFSALPGGLRLSGGSFYSAGSSGYWWTATVKDDASDAYGRGMSYDYDYVYEYYDYKVDGFSVRCVGD